MKGVVVREHGGLDTLVVEEVPLREPGPMEVLVAVKACGVNHLDLWVRRGVPGHVFPLPIILGNDVAGVVEQVGPGVADLLAGDDVVVAPGVSCGTCVACLSGRDHHCPSYGILGEHRDGGCAEFVLVPRANVMRKPRSLSYEHAAAVGIAFLTAWHMLIVRAELRPGETVLVQAAGSGVSSAAIQIAHLMRATVIATSGSDAKLERARALGAEHVLNYSRQDIAKEAKRITGGDGVDVVIEHVGAATWESSIRSLAWHGRLVTCGATTGPQVEINLRHLFFKSLSILGATMGSKGAFAEILKHVETGLLEPVVDRILPLSDVREAHRMLEHREVFGKVVLTI